MPVFAPKSAILHHYFQKFSGWNKCTQSAGKCTISHDDFKNFPGVTPPYPLWGRAQAPCIFGPSALKKPPSGFVGPPLSKVVELIQNGKMFELYGNIFEIYGNMFENHGMKF